MLTKSSADTDRPATITWCAGSGSKAQSRSSAVMTSCLRTRCGQILNDVRIERVTV